MAYWTGKRSVEIVREDLRPSQILTRAAFENAIAVCSAIGGSTNAPIQLNAIARHVGVELDNDDWERIGYDVFRARPQLSKIDYLTLGWNALRGRLEG